MKLLKLLILLLISLNSFGQSGKVPYYTELHAPTKWDIGGFEYLFIPKKDTARPYDISRVWVTEVNGVVYKWNTVTLKWDVWAGGGGGNPGTTIPNAIATITGGVTLELMAAGPALSYDVNWSVSRPVTGAEITSIKVGNIAQDFDPPGAGNSVSDIQTVSIPRNINTTISIVVTTADGKTVTASTVFSFSARRYFGWVNSTTPTNDEILAAQSEFSSDKAKTWTQSQPSGSQNLFIFYPASQGALSAININTDNSILAFEFSQRNFTTASGYTQLYNLYVSTNKFNITNNTDVIVK